MTHEISEGLRRQARRAFEAGELAESERCLAKALKRNPKDHFALALRGELLLRGGDASAAFTSYLHAVNAAPNVRQYKKRFLELAQSGQEMSYSDELANAIVACLKTPDLASQLENWSSLLFTEPRFRAAYGLHLRKDFDPENAPFFAGLEDFKPLFTPLFLEGIKSNVVYKPLFEEFITHIRRHLLLHFGAANSPFTSRDYVLLAAAVSHYAFYTDFILDAPEHEQEQIDALNRRIQTDSSFAKDAAAVALLACYRPLHRLTNAKEILDRFRNTVPLADVVKTQIADYHALIETAAAIASVTSIDEASSAEVREQYESFPYPRWKTLSKEDLARKWNEDECSIRVEGRLRGGRVQILVAGCGTGKDPSMLATIFPDAAITAVDLSRMSLAYAALKAREHGLSNISFWHGDILKLGELGRQYDYVASTGVLHHLENPFEGWKLLCGLLKPGGLMRIGLYSERARRPMVAARAAIARGNYAPTREGMLRFRRESPGLLAREQLEKLVGLKDYYHMNMYRDLLFHVREHRFDLLQIQGILKQLNLSFETFHVSRAMLANYREMFPGDATATNLENWNRFEQTHPDSFVSMYTFWCRKAA